MSKQNGNLLDIRAHGSKEEGLAQLSQGSKEMQSRVGEPWGPKGKPRMSQGQETHPVFQAH